ncbi:copper resistance system multicopper oxidase [Methylicorpusculum oleiharenae]|uniref:copper resistance system multicopper oxidase n=1 Tax=Methylicorpusculum oleiharenae TaxID=1338687 RepID=UPI0019D31369|nr:copper resistance system multicopper oxidase [Methylicorpusculum oleiharenae]MCD2449691.1 copper resistance system multicopper oxidase [Methylicorpusculum oleiharenae]
MLNAIPRHYLFKTLCMLFIAGLGPKPGVLIAGEYNLAIDEKAINVIGQTQKAYLADDSLPAPTLRWREGELITLNVTNRLKETTSLHWHGIILPYEMDGVPGISFSGIKPGETFTYRFPVNQSGTYWYHGHSGMQEQMGLYGALIIDPAEEPHPVDRDIVIILSDWPQADPHRTMARLKKQSDYYNFQKRTVPTFFQDIQNNGLSATLSDRWDWGWMRMDPTDLADVNGSTYRFLINGQTPETNWTALFKPGEKIRLRFINASAMTYFDVRIPHLKMRVIEADGQAVVPVDVDEFRIAVAETYNVLVEPQSDQAYTVFAEAMDRSGYARATLTPHKALQAEVPALRPMTLLTLADMGGEHGEHAGHKDYQQSVDADELSEGHGSHQAETAAAEKTDEHAGHNRESMPHEQTQTSDHQEPVNGNASEQNHERHQTETPLSENADEHAGHQMNVHLQPMNQQHQQPEAILSTDVLKYEHLKAVAPNPEGGEPDREITLRLTGNMYRYIWSFDDIAYKDAEPIKVRFGERIRFKYVNETMMNHPIHIHGLWQYLVNGQGNYKPKKHVINVKPGETVEVDVIADAVGDWAFHCHLLYHMDTGMFRKLTVEQAEDRVP